MQAYDISISLSLSANDMRKKALLLRFPTKDKLKRTGRQADMDYLTEV